MISETGGCEEEEEARHRVGEMIGIVCDERMHFMLKVAVYKTVIIYLF